MHKTSTLVLNTQKINKSKRLAEMPAEVPEISDSIIQSILNYSKSLTVKKSDSVGFIEVVAS